MTKNSQISVRNLIYLVVLGSFFLVQQLAYGQCTGANSVQNPVPFNWTYHPVTARNPVAYYSGVLEVGQATFLMNNGQTLTTRAYRQQGGSYSIPGPTIRVVPGNKYVLQFRNTLPYAPLSTGINVYKDPNASNIHTHGLHISGESPGDDVMRTFEGGRGGDFVWDIPADHIGGTYWYHAHNHGSSFLQVSGGLFGMLIVDDSGDVLPANVAAMSEKHLVVGYLDPSAAGTGGDVLLSGTLTPTWTVNGVISGNICMPANTWQHWRVLLADRNSGLETLSWGPEADVMLLARDGVWRTVTPLNLSTKSIAITGASRVDLAIRIKGNSTFKINGNLLANIIASGTSDPGPNPFASDGVSTWSAKRPYYLRDLRGLSPISTQSISMGARTINGAKFDENVPNFTKAPTAIQEWSISGAAQHPFHLHTYHLQAQSATQNYEAGEFYDVLAANINARFDLNASQTNSVYSGMVMMHCHILAHEDQGAMGWMYVTGGQAPPTFPADGDLTNPYSVYYVLGGGSPPAAPSSLTAAAASSSSINLTWIDNSADESGFTIERSADGINFTTLPALAANAVSYTDNGLTASTAYSYRVKAFNSSGNSSPSNLATATTQASTTVTDMRVQSLIITRASASAGRVKGVATIKITTSQNVAVSGATVTGLFSGPTTGSFSGTTDASGQVIFNASPIKNPTGQWCFEVTNVTKTGNTYTPSSNLVTKACENGPVARTATSTTSNCCKLTVTPNPFSESALITYELPEYSDVQIVIYDFFGNQVAVLSNSNQHQGHHDMHADQGMPYIGFNAIEFNSESLPNGIYLCRMKAGNYTAFTRMLLKR